MMTSTANNFSELYSAYAAGCLDPAFALLVETQSAILPDIKRSVNYSEIISGVFLEREGAEEMADNAAASVLARIDELDARDEHARKAAIVAGSAVEELLALPEPLREHAIRSAGHGGWTTVASGIRRLALDVGSQMETELYRIVPGAAVPRHTHAGHEYTLVVAGGFTDETGSYGPGDLVVKDEEDVHQPVGDAGEVCFALSVRDGGLRFTGVMGMIQKVLGG